MSAPTTTGHIRPAINSGTLSETLHHHSENQQSMRNNLRGVSISTNFLRTPLAEHLKCSKQGDNIGHIDIQLVKKEMAL
jgi:hypothetical protein